MPSPPYAAPLETAAPRARDAGGRAPDNLRDPLRDSASFAYDAEDRLISKGWPVISGDPLSGTLTESSWSTAYLYDGLNPVQEQISTTSNFVTSSTSSADLLTGLGVDEVFIRTDRDGR